MRILSSFLMWISFCNIVMAQDVQLAELAGQARATLRIHCVRCHSGAGSEGGEFDVMQVDSMTENEVVVPGGPGESSLLARIVNEEMPPSAVRQRHPVSVGEAEVLRRWIAAQCPPFPVVETRQFLKTETILSMAFDYVRQHPVEDRQYIRFFTLHPLYNNPAVLQSDLNVLRAAVSKSVNSLTWNSRITPPVVIDQAPAIPKEKQGLLAGTVMAIDIRDYDWDQGGQWGMLLRTYPYGLGFNDVNQPELADLDHELSQMTQSQVSLIRADWFVASATRPPLYHQLLDIPRDASTLEQTLGVDIARSFMNPSPQRIARAGFSRSGVSGQNRLVERHSAKHGNYWKSYDFRADSARIKLSRFPLGPLNLYPSGQHPFQQQAFVHDGGEIIFSLPNGLQGYMLTDGENGRIDAGPIDVVSDPIRTSGTPAIVNGLSCMSCHKHGMIPFQDTIRSQSAIFGRAEQHVDRLYPEATQMQVLLDQDERQFMQALHRAIGSFVGSDGFDSPGLRGFVEPCGEVARSHRLIYMNMQTIAAELDFEATESLVTQVGERRLKELGLEPLLRGGVIGRQEWEAQSRGVSLMQELGRSLGYRPIRPL